MGDSKSIGQLLKELDAMQKQFDNLNEELIVEKKKTNNVKTELSSNKIDDDFFKTFSVPLIKKDIKKEIKPETDLASDEFLFELDIEQEALKEDNNKKFKENLNKESQKTPIIEKTDKEKVANKKTLLAENKNVEIKTEKIEKAIEPISDQKAVINDYSYLTIKQRLEKIQQEINLKEKTIKEVKLKNTTLQDKNKVVKLKQKVSTNEILAPRISEKTDNKNKSSVLKPTEQVKTTIDNQKKEKNNINKNTSSSNQIKNSESILNPVKISKDIKTGSVKKKQVDGLTIIILVLLVVLFVTAWLLLY